MADPWCTTFGHSTLQCDWGGLDTWGVKGWCPKWAKLHLNQYTSFFCRTQANPNPNLLSAQRCNKDLMFPFILVVCSKSNQPLQQSFLLSFAALLRLIIAILKFIAIIHFHLPPKMLVYLLPHQRWSGVEAWAAKCWMQERGLSLNWFKVQPWRSGVQCLPLPKHWEAALLAWCWFD